MLPTITLNGAGLVGSLLACLLADRGYPVQLFDKRPDPRKTAFKGGRSINLALSDRGWKALETAGLAAQVREQALPMKGRMMHDTSGKLTFQPYGKEGQAIYSVSRSGLNELLLSAAEAKKQVQLFFEHACESIDLKAKNIRFAGAKGEKISKHYEWLIGADGAFSVTRQALQATDRFNYSQTYLESGYKELTIPPTAQGGFALDPEALHIWPRGKFMLIALPNQDRSFTATLFLPFEGTFSFENLSNAEAVTQFFHEQFPDTLSLIPRLTNAFFENPTSSLMTVRCNPWSYRQEVLLIGDAAHAIVPFYGQGMNAGFEDCSVLINALEKHPNDWKAAIASFEQTRIADANAISELALRNFIEMRDKVADPDFLLQKKMEAKIQQQLPTQWLPLYSRVTFSHKPYHEALQMGDEQDAIMKRIMTEKHVREQWENMDFTQHPIIGEYIGRQPKK